MAKQGLTDKQVKYALPMEKRYEVAAKPPVGLFLVIHPTGKKGWCFRYRYAGKTRNLTFPKGYPDMSLAAARAEAQSKVDRLKEGVDPAIEHVEEKRQQQPNAFEVVADEWLLRTMTGKATHDEVQRLLKRNITPNWKHKLIGDIQRSDILRLYDQTIDRGAPVLANRILTVVKRLFKWCQMRGYIEHSPAAVIRATEKEESRDRVLTEEELRAIWQAAPDLGYPFGDYFRFLILTGQRRGEVANMMWPQIDIDAALWTLPKTATKARRIHDVPLSDPAVELVKSMTHFEGPYAFTSTSGKRPISGFSKSKTAIDDAILERRKKAAEKAGVDLKDVKPLAEWHVHDLRRTVATWMADNGIAPHVVAAILNHSPGSTIGITAVYARSRWSKEKREALNAWAKYVSALSEEKAVVQAATA